MENKSNTMVERNGKQSANSPNDWLLDEFKKVFGDSEHTIIIKSPACLTLLGDHTHYNDGLLLTSALDRYSYIAMRKAKGNSLKVHFNGTNVPLENLGDSQYKIKGDDNTRNIRKLFQSLLKKEIIAGGVECLIHSEIPKSLGLGYFAATQMGLMLGLKKIFSLKFNDIDLINLVHEIEKEFLGPVSNRANYFASLYGKKNTLLYVDLRTNEYKHVKFDNSLYNLVICDTNMLIENSADTCRNRIDECAVGVKGLKLYVWGIKNLRDVEMDFLKKHIHMIPKLVYKRCAYSVSEKQRVMNAYKFLGLSDVRNFSKQIIDSYRSIKTDYDLYYPEVDFLVNEALLIEGLMASKSISCTTAKSTYNFVRNSNTVKFIERLNSKFKSKYGKELKTMNAHLSSGAKMIFES